MQVQKTLCVYLLMEWYWIWNVGLTQDYGTDENCDGCLGHSSVLERPRTLDCQTCGIVPWSRCLSRQPCELELSFFKRRCKVYRCLRVCACVCAWSICEPEFYLAVLFLSFHNSCAMLLIWNIVRVHCVVLFTSILFLGLFFHIHIFVLLFFPIQIRYMELALSWHPCVCVCVCAAWPSAIRWEPDCLSLPSQPSGHWW